MNKDRIIKVSNAVGMVSITLLIYWVFIFISITVFELKVFKENITESFYLSIIGILSLMFGALMINIMLNLTKISDYVDKKKYTFKVKSNKLSTILFISSFPLIFALLYTGDKLTSNKKEKYLIDSAAYLTEQYAEKVEALSEYTFTEDYIKRTEKTLDYLSKIDDNLPNAFVIVQDTVEGTPTYLRIRDYQMDYTTKENKDKIEYIYSCSMEEKEYLNDIFTGNEIKPRFSSHDGRYELFYPVLNHDQIIVIYFSEYQRYGKIGS
ncbi:hypothetical protein E9993_17290 [Labilibacter sediminis]|nr:hypothetical protein E9993_17290 [Labilibacter sediminis]